MVYLIRIEAKVLKNSKNTLISKTTHILVIVIALLLLTITLLVAYGFFVVEKNRLNVAPLKTSVHRILLEIEEVHQFVQKLAATQSRPNIEYVWFQIDQAVSDYHKIVMGKENTTNETIPAELYSRLISDLELLDEEIDVYKVAANRLFNRNEDSEKDSPDKLFYERAYNAVLTRLDGIEVPIDNFLQRDLLFFRRLMFGGVIICIVLSFMIATTLRQFIKKTASDYIAITTAHKTLKNEFSQRKTIEKSLKQSEELFRTIFETSPDAVVITRIEDSIIIDVNHGFTEYSGYEKKEVVGRSVHDIELWQDPELRKALLNQVDKKGFARNYEAVLRSKQAVPINCLLSTTRIDINGKQHILTVARDISDRILSEKKIYAANRFLHIGNRHVEVQPLLADFVMELKRVSGCSATAVRILDKNGKIPYAASNGFDSDFCNNSEPLSIHSEKGMCARVIKNQKGPFVSFFTDYGSYHVNSTSEFLETAADDLKHHMRNTCHKFGYETVALVPIRSGDRTIGLIHAADQEANRLDNNTIEILEAAALQLGTAIERVRAAQELKDSHDALEKQVTRRTEMLLRTKDNLVLEIEQRKRYEQELLGFQQRLRELSARLIQTEARERRHIASKIHDRIGQTLAVIKMQLGAVKAELDFQDMKNRIESIRELVSQTIHDVRTLTFELSPPILYELGLKAALESLAEKLHNQSGLEVEIQMDGNDRGLDADRALLLFRTCSELLLNVVKHAGARQAQVFLTIDSDLVAGKITDDGVGFDPIVLHDGFDPSERGFGLFSIQEQLQSYGGAMEVNSVRNQGSSVTITLPLKA